jgi:hypothetical protein
VPKIVPRSALKMGPALFDISLAISGDSVHVGWPIMRADNIKKCPILGRRLTVFVSKKDGQ